MQRREQYLLIGLIAAVVVWWGSKLFQSTLLDPLQARQEELEQLQQTVSERNAELVQLARQRKNLSAWTRRSLPPDPKSGKQRPDALNAQRLYQDWLYDLALLSGFEDLKVSPDRRAVSRDNVFVSVSIRIEAEARYEQLCRFLDRFYRADLLHRITSLRVQSKESEGDPFLKIEFEAEGLALIGAPQARRLFAQTVLVDDLSDDATALKVESNDEFPKEPGFLVRLKSEYLKVTAMDRTTWTVERAQDATAAAGQPAGTIAEFVRTNADVQARTPEEFKHLLDSNIFVKPAPPVQYKPRLAPLGEKSLTRGKPLEFNIVAMGYDPAKGRPEFALVGPTIAGSRLDRSTGKFSWTPSTEQKAGKYTFKFEVKHPSAPGGRLTDSVTVVLRDPNSPPEITRQPPPPVFLGRPWEFTLRATDAETSPARLTWKLDENPPPGLQIDGQSGKLTWTPDDSTDIGETTVKVTVSDDGSPPQSSSLALNLQVQDDAAVFTHLVAIFSVNGQSQARLYDRSQNKFTELRVGTSFSVADIKGTVNHIDKKFLEFSDGELTGRMEVGQSLREVILTRRPATTLDSPIPDATRPENVQRPPDDSDAPAPKSASPLVGPDSNAATPRPAPANGRNAP